MKTTEIPIKCYFFTLNVKDEQNIRKFIGCKTRL